MAEAGIGSLPFAGEAVVCEAESLVCRLLAGC